jgi:heterodisulfide reductase subunit B
MRFSLFLGCTAPNLYAGIEAATRKIAPFFDIELIEMVGASCCPAPGAFGSIDKNVWLVLGARNLCIAEDYGCDIVTVCNGCFSTLYEVNNQLQHDEKAQKGVNEILSKIGREYKGTVKVRHIVEVLYRDVGPSKVKEEVLKSLEALNIAVHYGCHLLKPSKGRKIDSTETPEFLDELVEATGAKSIPYKDKMLCCGGGGGVRGTEKDESIFIAMQKLRSVKNAGADIIVNPCSFCTLHYDMSQPVIKEKFREEFNLPVMHYTQFLALSLGIGPKEVGLHRHIVPITDISKLMPK